jgi:antitoxin ParD1/3/4
MPEPQPQSRNTSIALNSHFAGFIDRQVRSGRYETASDVMRAGLRLLEEHETRVKALEDALIAGEQSKKGPFDHEAFEAFKAGKRAEFGLK